MVYIQHVNVEHLRPWFSVWFSVAPSDQAGIRTSRFTKYLITNKGKDMEELTRKRHAGFISAISRADLTEKIMSNDRICSRHFISGKPASPLDENNPDWLPTLNMGHSKKSSESRARAVAERWERIRQGNR